MNGAPVAAAHCDVCRGSRFEHAFDRGVDGARLDRCVGCGLVFLNPRPSDEEIATWYDQGYFTRDGRFSLGEQYLSNADAGIRHGTEHFFQLARRQGLRGRRLLEIGVGGGAFLVQCREAGARVVGLDVSAFAAQRVRDTYGVDVRTGTPDDTDLEAGYFDIVAFTDVLEHVPSPTQFLRGVHRLLRPSGQVFGVVPNLDAVAHYGQAWLGLQEHAEHLYYFGRATLDGLVRRMSLEPVEIWSWGEPSRGRTEVRGASHPASPSAWMETLRSMPGVLPSVRALRRWGRLLSPAERARLARYHGGLGHDLYFRAVKR